MNVEPVSNMLIEICLAGIVFLSFIRLHKAALQSHIGLLAIILVLLISYYASRKKEWVLTIGKYVLPIMMTYMFFRSKGLELTVTPFGSAEIAIPYAIIALSVMVIGWLVKQCATVFPFSFANEFYAAVFLTVCFIVVMALFLAWMVDGYYGFGFSQAVLLLSNVMQFLVVLVIAADHFARRNAVPRALVYFTATFIVSVTLRIIV